MSKNITKIDIHNLVNSSELESIVKLQMKTIMDNPEMSKTLPPILVTGAPGIGKSSIIKGVANDLEVEFIDFRLSQVESVDLRGIPVPTENGFDWKVANVFPRDPDSKGILFLDELTSASKDLQVCSYQLILDRALGEYHLPDGWLVVAAGNRIIDRAVATTMSSALANRFLHLELDANAEDWIKWAYVSNIHHSVIGFINYRPGLLFNMDGENLERGWPSPRSWEKVSRMIDLYHGSSNEAILRKIVYGLIGNRAGIEFIEFFKYAKNADDILKMMVDPNSEIKIPEAADRRYAFVSAMVYLLWRGKDKIDEDNRLTGFYRIVMELPADFATLAMTGAMAGNDNKIRDTYATKLVQHKMFKDWSKKFGKAFKKHLSF